MLDVDAPEHDVNTSIPDIDALDPVVNVEEINRPHSPETLARWRVNSQTVPAVQHSITLQRPRAATLPAPTPPHFHAPVTGNSEDSRRQPGGVLMRFLANLSRREGNEEHVQSALARFRGASAPPPSIASVAPSAGGPPTSDGGAIGSYSSEEIAWSDDEGDRDTSRPIW
jgi:hypothetical protein